MSRRSPGKPLPEPEGENVISRWSPLWLFLALLAAVVFAYLPALRGGLLWDDAGHVTRPDLRSLAGLARIWFEPGATQQYYPVLHSAFWIEHRLWGDATAGYHLVNVLWHTGSATLFALLLLRLRAPGAVLAAFLFALHPVCVESVAWISEQKNTLSTLLYLAAALAYLSFDQRRRPPAYLLATALFLTALLAKTVTATLPAALLVVLWWRRGTLEWRRDVLPVTPWLVAGLLAGLFTARFEYALIGAHGSDFSLGWLERGLLAARMVWFYLGKLAWPAELTFIYPRWTIDAGTAWQWGFPLALAVLLVLLMWVRGRMRAPLAAALHFGGTLFPVLGFLNVYPFLYSYVADHFQYLAALGPLALAAGGSARLAARGPTWVGRSAAILVLGGLAVLTSRQAGLYRDATTLYRATITRNPACWMAHNNLAIELTAAGRLDEAVQHLRRALALRPDYPEAENNLGDNLNRLGRPGEAVPHLERALALQADYAEAHNNLGVSMMALERPDEGRARFGQAVRLRPDDVQARRNLGRALASGGALDQAAVHFAEIVRLEPDSAEARMDLGFALFLLGRPAEATPHLEAAVRLRPGSAPMRLVLGRSLAAERRIGRAIEQFEAAVRLEPGNREARESLAAARRLSAPPR